MTVPAPVHTHAHDDHECGHGCQHDHDGPLSLTVFSAAGVIAKAATLRLAVKRLRAHGFDTQLDDSALAKSQRFAGDDATRLAALHRVAASGVSIAMSSRGGYGFTRLLDGVDYAALQRSIEAGTRWVGHSDFTALQLALLAHSKGAVTYAGPMANYDFGGESVDEVTEACFVEAMRGELEAVGFKTEAGFDGLDLKGTLWGGNLWMVCSLLGTRHMPRIKGGILFVEDVNEHPYRVERNLLHLHQAGVLDAQKAIVLGRFTDYKPSPLDRGYTLKTVVDYLRSVTSTPILTGLPFGHVPTKVTLPVGAKVQLVVQGRDVLMAW
ncbi:LD-carboxypeptidase [Caldimonas brevitalea]|uniref:Muramoyltetrapeptide carboxypeptidase n=1 Tax=Caldimonas brevitalea TaxID=413882 RepID=A0A0G3BRM8_9BURK|nr:LD-carboxypeptidase [Caldimonas brevitalea]AKJ29195.1 muramoyltetrapeptide carboxypeptidase [Caldimonas brevitalea]